MSEQDADDADTGQQDGEKLTDDSEASGQSAGSQTPAEKLEAIAEEPADVDAALSAIITDGETADTDTQVDTDQIEVEDDFVETLEEASTEKLGQAIIALRQELSQKEAELTEERERADDLESRLKRKQADFQNYKKRQKERMEEEKQRATEDLVSRLVDVRDNLQRALEQEEDTDIRGGVESTLEQFDQELDRENVEPIEPTPGEDVDPQQHEVLATIESDQPEDTIAGIHRSGYEMADKVLRPAQITVSDGSGYNGSDTGDDANEETAASDQE